jgi:hypothetical protein
MTATVSDILALRGRLAALRDDVLDQLCQGIGSGEIELLAATGGDPRAPNPVIQIHVPKTWKQLRDAA